VKKNSISIRTYKYLIAACLASLIISTLTSYFFYKKWNESEDGYVSLFAEKNVATQNFNAMKIAFDKIYNDLIEIRDENATVFTLQSSDSTKRYKARVYWNHYTRQAVIDVLSLPVPDSGSQYQLWAIASGQPVSAGVFNATPDAGVQHMQPVVQADSWAVTLEPKGGSMAPAAGQLYLVSGN
jgi:anti-sigma-K factor RskA